MNIIDLKYAYFMYLDFKLGQFLRDSVGTVGGGTPTGITTFKIAVLHCRPSI